MKRLFIVTLATLTVTMSFVQAGQISKVTETAKKEVEEKTKGLSGKQLQDAEEAVLNKIAADLKNDRLSSDNAKVAIDLVFKGEENQLIKSLAFQKALAEARQSTDAKVKDSALFAEKMLSNLNGVQGEGYKEEIRDVLRNYAELLSDMPAEAAVKLGEHLKSMSFLTDSGYIAKLNSSNTKLLSREEIRMISVARAMKADLGIADGTQLRTMADLRATGKMDEIKKKSDEFTNACGKKG